MWKKASSSVYFVLSASYCAAGEHHLLVYFFDTAKIGGILDGENLTNFHIVWREATIITLGGRRYGGRVSSRRRFGVSKRQFRDHESTGTRGQQAGRQAANEIPISSPSQAHNIF